ncbi:MAG: biotin--[acetyl-CoA-carboxylase] ligase [Candidatus Protistobacter heckmanni]|nr:biotin--[acetyl-CoA-carboxylase] ligase [Candidatus Protistobacter heckmanni]
MSVSQPPRLNAERVQSLLQAQPAEGRGGPAEPWRIECVAQTGSTNADLLERLRGAAPELIREGTPMLRQADGQSAGRGRLGRKWHGSAGASLMFSLAWPLPLPLSALGGLSLACGVAVVDALRGALETSKNQPLDGRLALKWPNDVLLDGLKLAGILIEIALAPKAGPTWVVIGIGLNLHVADAAQAVVGRPLAGLDRLFADGASASAPEPEALLARLAAELDARIVQFGREGFAGIAARWNALDAYAGQPVRILPGTGGVGEGEALFEGLAEGVDAGGALRLRTAQGMRSIVAGEVSLRPGA